MTCEPTIREHTEHCLRVAEVIANGFIRAVSVADLGKLLPRLNGQEGDELTARFLAQQLSEPGDAAPDSRIRPEALTAFSKAVAPEVRPALVRQLEDYLSMEEPTRAAFQGFLAMRATEAQAP
jgi:hypothetical protein